MLGRVDIATPLDEGLVDLVASLDSVLKELN